MHEPRATHSRVALGAAIIVALIAAGVLIFFLDTISRAADDRYEIVIRLREANALRVASDVQVAGKPVGRVTTIEFAPAPDGEGGPILATVKLAREVAPYVRRTSVPRVESQGLGGNAIINIMPGPAGPVLDPGDTLVASPPIDRDRLAGEAGRLARDLDSLMASVRRLAPEVDRAGARMAGTMAALHSARAAFGRVAMRYREGPLNTLINGGEWSSALDRLRAATEAIRGMWPETERMRSVSAELRTALNAMLTDADSLRADIQRLQAEFDANGGFIGRMGQDSAFAAALRGVSSQLDSLMAEAKSNPLRFIF